MRKSGFSAAPFSKTDITGGFWHERQRIAGEVSIYSVYSRFQETGRFDAIDCAWKEGMPNKPHIFWDSDVAKWLESAAYLLAKKGDPKLESICDITIDGIVKSQDENGYFNSYFTAVEPDMRFMRRTDHELYCAGHLMEAAVAYYQSTGKRALLDAMEKYARHIDEVFIKKCTAAFRTPGHQEIELALVRMAEATGNEDYLRMSRHFIDVRGTVNELEYEGRRNIYSQSHLPVREQLTAEGHCVRALYMYCAMADLASADGDESLKNACYKLFDNISQKRMYITGGVGSTRDGEAFTVDYDLPNVTAYAESCAALALALFARRLSALEADSRFADVAERAIYNGFLSGISLDGKSFFYENPLEIRPELKFRGINNKRPAAIPATTRKEVFSCSCCPPNITRFIASIADFLYTYDENTLFVHHFMDSETALEGCQIAQKTKYPADGCIVIEVDGGFKDIALRLPGWCAKYSITLNSREIAPRISKGYAYLPLSQGKNTIEVELDMKPYLIEAHPSVPDCAGKVAVQRGPVVYCLEAIDNGRNLRDIRLCAESPLADAPGGYGVPCVAAKGKRRDCAGFEGLYRPYQKDETCVDLLFIPYFAFANRGESEMAVWVNA